MSNFTEFNKQASQYARYRPSYPKELYAYLKGLCLQTKVAFDVGTGSGQCALALTHDFEKVFASDLSVEQIAHAIPHEKIAYFVARAHESGLPNESVDLITVATAIHWFDINPFYQEVMRILRPGGILAVWAYGWHECENAQVTQVFEEIGKGTLSEYWSEQPKLIWDGYKSIPFPFEELQTPHFDIVTDWNLTQMLGYISTWSATQKFIQQQGHHPADQYFDTLLKAWGDAEKTLHFRSPLHLRVGRKSL